MILISRSKYGLLPAKAMKILIQSFEGGNGLDRQGKNVKVINVRTLYFRIMLTEGQSSLSPLALGQRVSFQAISGMNERDGRRIVTPGFGLLSWTSFNEDYAKTCEN
jgi:hypothetical protein